MAQIFDRTIQTLLDGSLISPTCLCDASGRMTLTGKMKTDVLGEIPNISHVLDGMNPSLRGDYMYVYIYIYI